MTRPGIEPWSPGPLANTLPTRQWANGKEKVVAANEEDHADSLLGQYWFQWKGARVNSAFCCQLLKKNSTYLINDTCTLFYMFVHTTIMYF